MSRLSIRQFLALIAFTIPIAVSAQTVSAVVNSASNAPPGLPNSAIAQGSLFVVYGTGLGPSSIAQANTYPLPTTLAGTSVKVTVAGTTVNAIMVFTLASQVAAILPSSTPTGSGTLTVTYNGSTGNAFPITVVPSSFGTYTVNQQGSGAGILTYADYSLVTPTKAANPGETLLIWGTGLGPVSGNEAAGPLPGSFSAVPEVWVGNQRAQVTYAGRSGCCAGLDQIAFVVPQGVSGCSVSVAVKTGNVVSNFTSFAVANTGRVCADAGLPTGSALTSYFNAGTFRYGSITLTRSSQQSQGIGGFGGGTTKSDDGLGLFSKLTIPPGQTPTNLVDSTSYGSCSVTTFSGQTANPYVGYTFSSLDAGSTIGISGSSGNRTLTKSVAGELSLYTAKLGDTTPGNYLDPGNYTITGTGGADVGPFSVQIAVPPALTWTNQVSSVTRANGQLVTWTGGDPSGYVDITGSSFQLTASNSAVGASFVCRSPTSAGSFTIPAVVLLALPPSGMTGGFAIPGSLGISAATLPKQFTANGLDLGYANSLVTVGAQVTYQ